MHDVNQPLFELFESITAEKLVEMQSRREEESSTLEFKRCCREGSLSQDDVTNLKRAISGFANAAGGIVLWGVESKADDGRKDRSRFQRIAPIPDGEGVQIRLHELTATATQPPVSGVIHRAIQVDGGYVVKTFVPASDGGPHRTNEDRGQYFRRDADAFRAMQHYEIADMFGRRARPLLELFWQGRHDATLPDPHDGVWLIGLRNVGRGVARFPCLTLANDPTLEPLYHCGLDGMQSTGVPIRPAATGVVRSLVFAGGVNDVIHPNQEMQITRVYLKRGCGVVRVRFSIFAEGMRCVEWAFRMYPYGIRMDTAQEMAN
jgi:hypothetical protein